MTRHVRRLAPLALLLAAGAFCALDAGAAGLDGTGETGGTPADGCQASAAEIPVEALYGRWEVRFDDPAAVADVQLAAHPEYAGSVRGTISRGAQRAEISGDIDDEGFLILDESQDGRTISAVWSGELQPGSCGKEFKGTWRNSSDDSTQSFVLRKTGTP